MDLRQVVYLKGDPRSTGGEWGNESRNGRKLTSIMVLGRLLFVGHLGALWVLGDSIKLTSEMPNLGGVLHWPSADPEVLSPDLPARLRSPTTDEKGCVHWGYECGTDQWSAGMTTLNFSPSSENWGQQFTQQGFFVKIRNHVVNLLIVCPAYVHSSITGSSSIRMTSNILS